MSPESNTPKSPREMTPDEWLREVERAAANLVQHTYSGGRLAQVLRDDELVVRREDWDRLYGLLEPTR